MSPGNQMNGERTEQSKCEEQKRTFLFFLPFSGKGEEVKHILLSQITSGWLIQLL